MSEAEIRKQLMLQEQVRFKLEQKVRELEGELEEWKSDWDKLQIEPISLKSRLAQADRVVEAAEWWDQCEDLSNWLFYENPAFELLQLSAYDEILFTTRDARIAVKKALEQYDLTK